MTKVHLVEIAQEFRKSQWQNVNNFTGKYNSTADVLFKNAANIELQFKQYKVRTTCFDASHVAKLMSNCQAGLLEKEWEAKNTQAIIIAQKMQEF